MPTEVSVVAVVETLWPLPMLLSVSVAADRTEATDGWDGGGGPDRSVGGDGGGDALATANAAVCVGGGREDGCGRRR